MKQNGKTRWRFFWGGEVIETSLPVEGKAGCATRCLRIPRDRLDCATRRGQVARDKGSGDTTTADRKIKKFFGQPD